MLRLETVEDFETLDEVLKNLNSKMAEYWATEFGSSEIPDRRLFNQLLESRIKELKREQRTLSGKIRRLAKLRS